MTGKATIRILVVDDHELVRQGIRFMLESTVSDIEVVETAGNGVDALVATERVRPDVVLMDVRMPGMDGIETTRLLHERFPEIPVIVLTTFEDDESAVEAMRAGAAGFQLKDVCVEDFVQAIYTVHRGGILLPEKIGRKVMQRLAQPPQTTDDYEEPVRESIRLSKREREILHMLASGLTNKEIANRLFLAEGTVKNHLSHLYERLDARDRIQALSRAREYGLID